MAETGIEVLEERVARVEAAVQAIEARLALPTPPPLKAGQPVPAAAEPPQAMDMALIGKSVLIIGGAYLLRALTDLGVLGAVWGVMLAIVYALFWIWTADRALGRGQRIEALFDAATAALIAGPLLWEATTRFKLLSPSVAVGLVVAVAIALLAIALHQRSTTMAVIAVVLGTMTSIGVAIGTVSFVAPLLALSLLGVLVTWLSVRTRWPMYVALVPAAASDLLAPPLVVMCAIGKVKDGVGVVELALVAFSLLWLATPPSWARGQTVAATALGLGGAAFLAQFHHGHPAAIAGVATVIAVVAFMASARDRSAALLIAGALAVLAASLLALPAAVLPVTWAGAAVVSAAIGRRISWPALQVHAAWWSLAAATAAGLPVLVTNAMFSAGFSLPSRVPIIVCAVLAAMTLLLMSDGVRISRLVLLADCTASVLALVLADASTMWKGAILSTARTAAIAAAAVGLSFLSARIAEGRALAWLLLTLGGLKILVQDLTLGHATMLVISLALYGGAIVIVAHRRGGKSP